MDIIWEGSTRTETINDEFLAIRRVLADSANAEDWSTVLDISQIRHWGTGDVELLIQSHEDLDKAKPLIQKAYEG